MTIYEKMSSWALGACVLSCGCIAEINPDFGVEASGSEMGSTGSEASAGDGDGDPAGDGDGDPAGDGDGDPAGDGDGDPAGDGDGDSAG